VARNARPKDAKPKDAKPKETRPLATNPQAGHLYHLHERFEAGIALAGTEVKAIREGRVNLREAFVSIRNEEAFLLACHIGSYSKTGYVDHEPTRSRKLLLHKAEIRKLQGKLTLRGLTVVPTRMYGKGSHIKIELALAEGKKQHDKREAIRAREADREMARAMRSRRDQAS
jgi:SsrA-binding protein